MTNDENIDVTALLGDLERLLRGQSRSPLFSVIENILPQTKSLHVTVIWSRWNSLDVAKRGRLILEAYAKTGRVNGHRITLALGLTPHEATDMGLLPIRIVTTRRKDDPVPMKELTSAMKKARDGILRKGSDGVELRFPTLERAENVYRDLMKAVPGPYWSIVHEISRVA